MSAWSTKPLGQVVTLQRGFDLPYHARTLGDVPVVSSAGTTDYHTHAMVDAPGIVTGRYGTIGELFFLTRDFWPLNTTLYVRDFHGNDPRFVFYLLHRFDFKNFSGKSGVPGVNRNDLHAEPIIFTDDVEEQRAIAMVLSDIDALLEGLNQLIAKKRDLKQAAMQQLLTGETRLPGFTGVWKPLNMGRSSYLKARIGWQGLTTAEYLESGDYGLVTGTDFVDGRIDWDGCHFVEKPRYKQDRYIQLRVEDVLVTKDGTIGKAAYIDYLPFPTTLNSGVFVIRPINGMYVPKFFFYILMSRVFRDFLNQLAAGSTISHLYQKDFVGFEFSAPPTREEQSAIAVVLSDMDANIEALEQRRAKTADLKQAMMQELLTGRTRLVEPQGATL